MEFEIDGHYFWVKIHEYDLFDQYLEYEIEKYFEPDSEEPSEKEPPIEILDSLEVQIWESLNNKEDDYYE